MSSEEGHPDRMNVTVEEWQPMTPESDKDFFEQVMPRLKAIKETRLRGDDVGRALSEDLIQGSLNYLERRLRALKPGDSVPLAKIGSEIVGYLLVRWEESEKRDQLEQFYVDPKYRSQGIGSSLIERAVQHARRHHSGESKGIYLNTGERNEGAQRLYQRFGFHRSNMPAHDTGEIRLELDFTEQT